MARKPAIRREAGQTIQELALQLSGQEDNHLTALPERKNEAYPEVAQRLRMDTVANSISANRKRLKYIRKTRRVNLDDVDAVAAAADNYLAACEQTGTVPTMLSFAPSMGWSRKSIYQYLSCHTNETTRYIDCLQGVFAAIMAEMALNRQLSEPVSIFLLKNSGQGLSDKQELEVHPPEDPLARYGGLSNEQLRAKYIMDSLPESFDKEENDSSMF